MAIIPLEDGVRIQSDPNSWSVATWVLSKNKPGGGEWRAQTWHRTPWLAIQYWAEGKLRQSPVEGVEGLVAEAERLKAVVEAICEPVKALLDVDASVGEGRKLFGQRGKTDEDT